MVDIILNEIAKESGTNIKMEILSKYTENEDLKRAIYLALSKRVKFYIKQIPNYIPSLSPSLTLADAMSMLDDLSSRRTTGGDASLLLLSILGKLSYDDSNVIVKIILKDLKIGMGSRNVNKVFPKLIEKTPYMGATSFSPAKIKKILDKGNGAASDVKMDGRYCNAKLSSTPDGVLVELESRSGEPNILTGAKFLSELEYLQADMVYNGELTIEGIDRHVSNGMIQSMVDIMKKIGTRTPAEHAKHVNNFETENDMTLEEGLNSITYTVWDAITTTEYYDNKSNRIYSDRKSFITTQIASKSLTRIKLIESKFIRTYEEAIQHFQEMLNRGEEGTVVKDINGTWKDGKPNWQVKMKLELDIDLEIVGFNYGTGKNSDVISSLTCETSNGFLRTKPTGINEKTMQYITDHQEELMGTIIECKCSGLSSNSDGDYSVLHPVFKKFRDDKDIANTLQEVKDIENMAKGLV